MTKTDIERRVRESGEITEFQRRVYLALLEVPEGKTVSYKELAERVGCRSAQAVGQALKRNPFAPRGAVPQGDCRGRVDRRVPRVQER